MNSFFYLAIDRLPLGTVAAVEFLPVIALAALASRTGRNLAALTIATTGVYLLTDVVLAVEPLGLLFAAGNALLFTGYIVLGHQVANDPDLPPIDGLAISMTIAAVAALPVGFLPATSSFTDVGLLAAGVGVGVSSSVIPYLCDQLAMRRLARGTYALLVSLLPATATVIGVVVLTQVPTLIEVLGVALVIVGVALHREPATGRPCDAS